MRTAPFLYGPVAMACKVFLIEHQDPVRARALIEQANMFYRASGVIQ